MSCAGLGIKRKTAVSLAGFLITGLVRIQDADTCGPKRMPLASYRASGGGPLGLALGPRVCLP